MKRIHDPRLPPLALQMQPATDRRIVTASESVKLVTVAAAWPAGVSALALAVNACQRRDFRLEWPLPLRKKVVSVSAFCD